MKLQSHRLGTIEYTPQDVIRFPAGIPAFENHHEFLIVHVPRHEPILFLQSADDAALSLPLVKAQLIFPEYQLELSHEDRHTLCAPDESTTGEFEVYLVLAQFDAQTTVNPAAPIVVQRRKQLAVQAVRADRVYSPVHPLAAAEPASTSC